MSGQVSITHVVLCTLNTTCLNSGKMHYNIQDTWVICDKAIKSSNYMHTAISVGVTSEPGPALATPPLVSTCSGSIQTLTLECVAPTDGGGGVWRVVCCGYQ